MVDRRNRDKTFDFSREMYGKMMKNLIVET